MIEIDILPASTEKSGGDSILIRIGKFDYDLQRNQQTVVLIDSGYAENADRIHKYLTDHYGTSTIDCLVITHPDMDHISGLAKLLEDGHVEIKNSFIHDPWNHARTVFQQTEDGRRSVKSIGNKFEETLSVLSDVLEHLDDVNCEPFSCCRLIDGLNLYIIGPSQDYYTELLYKFPGMEGDTGYSSTEIYHNTLVPYSPHLSHFLDNPQTSPKNNSSVILLLHDSNNKPIALFTGDAGVEAISAALDCADEYGLSYKNVDLFQIPHHGSIKNINQSIIDRISSKRAFVSAPPKKLEHPAKHLLNHFHGQGVKVHHIKHESGIRFGYESAPSRPGWNPVIDFNPYTHVNPLKQ